MVDHGLILVHSGLQPHFIQVCNPTSGIIVHFGPFPFQILGSIGQVVSAWVIWVLFQRWAIAAYNF